MRKKNTKILYNIIFPFLIIFNSVSAVDDSDIFIDAVFFTAVKKSNYEKALEMIERGVSVNGKDSDGMSALAYCLKNDDQKMFDLLLSRGAKINLTILDDTSHLIFYISGKKFKLLEKILNAGSEKNFQDNLGRTPLMHAVEIRNIKAINFLLKKDVDLSITDYGGRTIFDYVSVSRDKSIKRLFQELTKVN